MKKAALAAAIARALAIAGSAAVPLALKAAELPVPCSAGSCGASGPASWVTSGAASAAVSGNNLAVHQTSTSATLNWRSFNISSDATVTFEQPDAASVALNRIYQADPSMIFGSLNANGTVFLLNQNGILFGQGAKVNVGGLVASTLDITPQAVEKGIAGAVTASAPAFAAFKDAAGTELPSGSLLVESGAKIATIEGGQVLMFAPEVVNHGTITTPGGQTVLAAGTSVYLANSADSNLRGLLVEVGVGGTVTNGDGSVNADVAAAVGQIVAERGNVTLAGLAVNQLGRITATTSVRQNGSVRLQARDQTTALLQADGTVKLTPSNGGTLQLGRGSVTEAVLADADDTTVDANAQPVSRLELEARDVQILDGARLTARGGEIDVVARGNPGISVQQFQAASPDGSRVFVAASAVLDAAGASVELPVERNVVRAELRGNQLADSPLQREGALRSKAVFVDLRKSGTRADGTSWEGTPLANVAGDIATVARGVAERSLSGGTVSIASRGAVIVAPGATVDVSGGQIAYQDGYVKTTQLMGTDGKVYDISEADPNRSYIGILGDTKVDHRRWGVTEMFNGFPGLGGGQGTFERGYVEGKDAGTIAISAPGAIVDGNLIGNVQVGRLQRNPTSAAIDSGRLYRRYDEVPAGARLVIGASGKATTSGPDFLVGDVTFHHGLVLPGLENDDGGAFDPLTDLLPSTLTNVNLRPELFGENRVSRASLFANGTVRLEHGETIALPAGGTLEAISGRVEIGGAVEVPAGNISLTSEDTITTAIADSGMELAAGARLSARGQWVNDERQLTSAPTFPALWIDGGTIALSAKQGSLDLAAETLLDVSAGAWARPNGTLGGGQGGNIRLSATPALLGQPLHVQLGAELRAYALSRGGSLQLTLGAACIAATDCSGGDPETTWLSPQFFSNGGFSSYAVTTNNGALMLAPDTAVGLQQRNLELVGAARRNPTGTDFASFTRIVLLPDEVRAPTSLKLATELASSNGSVTRDSFPDLPGLELGSRSAIDADPLAAISLQSNSSIVVDGAVRAPGGSIDVRLDASLSGMAEFLPSQGVWLGANGALDVSGVARLVPNDLGFRQGDVLAGGTVEVVASRGFFAAHPSSRIVADGAAAILDVGADRVVGSTRTSVASAGGEVSITSAEGMLLSGRLSAASGGGQALGGTLSVRLDPNERGSDPGDPDSAFSTAPRAVVLTQTAAALAVSPGTDLSDLLGQAVVAANQVRQGGFAALDLSAGTLDAIANKVQVQVPGEVRFDGDVSLVLLRRITLDAAYLSGGGSVRLDAPYVAIGNADRLRQLRVEPNVEIGGSFAAHGSLIELIGNTSIAGFGSVSLDSAADLRARGIQGVTERSIRGSLWTNADLTLRASQVYATTLSDFGFAIRNNAEGVLQVLGNGAARGDVLSAGSKLALSAPTVVNSGVLRAPLGEIDLQADDLTLESGSIVSTSTAGLTIPFGSTQGGLDWVYDLFDTQSLVFGGATGSLAPPQQRIGLAAANVDIRQGATLDTSGGGDLLSYEFVPGPGGTRDVLSTQVSPNDFAVAPALNVQFAPYDQREYAGSPLQVGDNVHLYGGSGLPEGDYVLLPARYSLLPGAFLVHPVAGYQDILPGESFAQLDGSTIVSGVREVAGTGFADSRSSGFAVAPASRARLQASYTTTRDNDFFARASADGDPSPFRIANDAGTVVLQAGSTLALNGSLLAQSVAGGRGAAVDIAGERLVVAAAGTAVEPGEVLLDAASLNQLGAESLFIGGARTATATDTRLDLVARAVTIGGGSSLHAPEIIVGGQEQVTVESGASVAGSGSFTGAPVRYSTVGDGAVLRVSGGDDVPFARTGTAGATGQLTLESGTTLAANGGSIALDATAGVRSDAQLQAQAGTLRVGADRIVITDGTVSGSGLVLRPELLADLHLHQLVLSSRSTVDVGSDLDFALNALSIEAGGISALAPDLAATITVAGKMKLSNPLALSPAPSTGGSRLDLHARDIVIGDNTFGFSGFDSTILRADDRLTAEGTAGVAASGGLDFVTGRVTADVGANLTVTAADVLKLLPAASVATPAADSDVSDHIGVGAHIVLRGARVEASSLVEAHGGSVTLESLGQGATSGVQIGPGGVIDVTGLEKTYDGVAQTIPGGDVELRAAAGDVMLDAGSRVDVSGAPGGAAGRLALIAHAGHVNALGGIFGTAGADGARDGSVHVDAGQVDQLGSLAAQLLSGGFTDEIYLRQRGVGNLIFGSAEPLRGHAVTLIADNGAVGVTNLDARGESGGAVRLVARGGITVGGNLDASATGPDGRGGSIELSSSIGGVVLLSSAVLNVSAGAGTTSVAPAAGKVNLRIPQTVLLQALADGPVQTLVSLGGRIVGSGRTALEGFTTYDNTGQLLAADLLANVSNPLFGDATTFTQNGPALAALLGRTDDPSFHVVPGVEIRSAGDLTLAADWNLFPWRFGGEPGVLTLRSSGDLSFDRSLSDGFQLLTGANGFALPATPTASWSYRLVAGADDSSADPLAVLGLDELAGAGGSVRIASGIVSPTTSTFRMVRTGTGTIEVAAARDFSLGNQASVLYTAGVAGTGIRFNGTGQLGGRTYPVKGGDIAISAGGDIVGATSSQLVTDWLFRVGRQAQGADAGVARAWTVNFQRFEQNIGALAGGNVTVRAGGNVDNLSVSIPTIGQQVGSNRATNDILQVIGGGHLTVEAAGSIRGGKYYVGGGTGVLDAGVELAALADGSGTEPIYPVVALGDARFSVTARDNLGVDGAVDPFLLPQGRTQNPILGDESFYSQYTDRSAVSLLSVAGDVTLLHSSALNAQIEGSFVRELSGRDIGLMVYAPSLTATSFARDLRLASPVSLFPSPVGNVNLFADRDVLVSTAASLLLSDVDPALLPTLATPQTAISVAADALVSSSSSPFVHAVVPVHDASRRGGVAESPARVVARTGDIAMTVHGLGDGTLLKFAKPARIIAARDLLDIGLIAQNVSERDVTSLIAGRDVRYSVNRSDNGQVLPSLRELTIDGPGDFQIQAGRNIDLQTSSGISTRGNISNPNLAPTGASVSLLAGVGSQGPDYAGFVTEYFKPDSAYASELTAFVREVTGQSGLGFDAAIAQFPGLDPALRRKLIERVFFEELRAGGRDAAVSPTSDFTRAFAALTTLFPGSNPPPDTEPLADGKAALAAGAANPYVGNIRLYFSRAYTLDGGDISLFAPGGEVNVGLAAPPAAFGINKPASQLGLVAQSSGSISSLSFRDFEVNESRVFAADGGDILVWATEGDIDAGRGAKTAISAPPPTINVDSNGRVQLSFPAALTGSGIQTLATSEGRKPGNVDLFAPRGVVNAGDAGIVAGNLTIAATAVLGADNISVSGVAVGVPVDTGGFAAALSGVSAVASSATSAAEDTVAANREQQESATPLSEAALSFLDVFVTGFGDATPNKDDDDKDKDKDKDKDN